MATPTQYDLQPVAAQMEVRPPTTLALMQLAIEKGQVEQLQILQEMRYRDQDRLAELEFNVAMNAVQSELTMIGADMVNPSTKSKYASYAKLDKVVRPLYVKHGLSLSFSEEDSPKADHVRIICYVSKGSHTRIYRKDMPVDTKGAKGGDVMTKTHATSSADSYAKRYLVKDIFNLAIGEDDTDGNARPQMDQAELAERLAHFPKCSTLEELEQHYRASYIEVKKTGDQGALDAIVTAKNTRKAELRKAGAQ